MVTRRDLHVATGTLVALCVYASFLPACASTGGRDTEGVIAQHGLTVAQTIASIQQMTVDLTRAGTIQPPQAIKAQDVFKQISVHGQELAQVLRVIDATRGATAAAPDVSKARELINKISDGIIAVTALVADGPAAESIRNLVKSLLATTNVILFELGKEVSS